LAPLTSQIYDQATNSDIPEPTGTSEASKFKTQITKNAIPSPSIATSTNKVPARKQSMLDHSTPTEMVSAFCRAVLLRLVPSEFWGAGNTKAHNEKVFFQNVDQFIGLRKFESLSLHEVCQGLKVSFPNNHKSTL
jgi:telomerase reverse transcriptase